MGKVHEYIQSKIMQEGALHFTLVDPEDVTLEDLSNLIRVINECGSDAIMVGGSTVVDQVYLSDVVREIKNHTSLPVILFPNNVSGITYHADAIWFMSLLNSLNPYYIIGAQMLAAPYIKKLNLEALSMAYLIVGEGKAAGFIGNALPIPYDKPKIALAYAIAAEFIGFKYLYLEAGSGAVRPVPEEFIRVVKSRCETLTLVVGGGIRSYDDAYKVSKAGADIIVTGTVIEEDPQRLYDIVRGVKEGAGSR